MQLDYNIEKTNVTLTHQCFKDCWGNGLKGVNWSKGGGPLFYCHPVECENGLLNLKTQTKSFTMLGKAKNWVSFTWTQALSSAKPKNLSFL